MSIEMTCFPVGFFTYMLVALVVNI